MTSIWRRWSFALLVGTILTGAAPAAAGQQPAAEPSRQVLSANPFGLLLGLFNAEYERVVATSATAGIGGSSYFRDGAEDYVNADVFVRFYPSGRPLEGFAIGMKAGTTSVPGRDTAFGVGIDTNWSWLLGSRDNFYVGIGFGLKRLIGNDDIGLRVIPTVRLVNLGVAF